jgi:hypothetical protein
LPCDVITALFQSLEKRRNFVYFFEANLPK